MITKNMLINNVVGTMAVDLTSVQLEKLENALRIQLHGIELKEECTELSTYMDDNENMLELFAANKKLQNLSDKTIKQYVTQNRKMFDFLNKRWKDITTDDIKYYLAKMQMINKLSPCSLSNMKRFISAFYSWALDDEYITRNPVHAIKNIKQPTKEKIYLSSEEVEAMRDNCQTLRERAILELLLDTGMRVSEIALLNRNSIDLITGEVRIYATKGSKWRTGYINARAKRYIAKYLDSRNDTNEALFVTERRPHKRLKEGAYESEVKAIGNRIDTDKHISVHIFRKTFATNLSSAGVPIEVIKELLGHANISVTEKNYVTIDQDKVKAYHKMIA